MKQVFVIKKALTTSLFLLLLSTDTFAARLTGVISTDAEYSNNIGLQSTKKIDDIKQAANLNIGLREDRKHFQANADFNLKTEHYYNGTFSDETSLTTGFGLFNFDLIESFLTWKTSFSRTEVLSDSTDSDTPDNREQRNIFSTGPSLLYKISRTSSLDLSAKYINVENSDEGDFDPEHVNGDINYTYKLNRATRIAINSNYNSVIDGDGDEEYKQIQIGAGFWREVAYGMLQFNYGRTRLMPDHVENTETNVFDIIFSRKQLLLHDIKVLYKQDVTSSSIGFIAPTLTEDGKIIIENGKLAITHGSKNFITRRKQFSFSANRYMSNYNYVVNIFWQQDESSSGFSFLDSNERLRGGSIRVEQQISPSFVTGFEYSFQLKNFSSRPDIGKDKTSTYRFDASYSITTDFSINSFVGFDARSNARNQAREYEEISTGFGLKWNLF